MSEAPLTRLALETGRRMTAEARAAEAEARESALRWYIKEALGTPDLRDAEQLLREAIGH